MYVLLITASLDLILLLVLTVLHSSTYHKFLSLLTQISTLASRGGNKGENKHKENYIKITMMTLQLLHDCHFYNDIICIVPRG